jgi:hypothetical protein
MAGGDSGGSGEAGHPVSVGRGGSDGGVHSSSSGEGGELQAAGRSPNGQAGKGSDPGRPVSGRVIDSWRHPLGGIPVTIGNETVVSDQNGEFRFADVPGEYDVSLVITYGEGESAVRFAWAYLGLERDDPTLQVFSGEPAYSAHLTMPRVAASDGTLWLTGVGSAHSAFMFVGSDSIADSFWWSGPSHNELTIHRLVQVETDFVPTQYLAYGAKALTAEPGGDYSISLVPSGEPIATGTVSGTVTGTTDIERSNTLYLRFESGASLPMVADPSPAGPSYEYLVPVLPGATIAVSASERTEGGYSRVHCENVLPGATGVELRIPPGPKLVSPAADAMDLAPDTTFEFSPGNEAAHAHVVTFRNFYSLSWLFVVTGETKLSLADSRLANVQLTGDFFSWKVETHGQPASVDEMAGPTGFIDDFARGFPAAVQRSDGSYATTSERNFRLAR